MAYITATEARERTPSITTAVYSDANVEKIITRVDAEIVANAGRYREMLQGRVFGERVSLASTGGNKRLKAQGGETSATLSMKPVAAGTLFLFKNASGVQDYRHITGNESALLTLTTDYSINATTGVVTLVEALNSGDRLTATYGFTMDTTNRAPRVILELAKSLAAYYLTAIVYGNANISDGSEVSRAYANAQETLKMMVKNQFPIPEFDDVSLVDIEEWQAQELQSVKIIRR